MTDNRRANRHPVSIATTLTTNGTSVEGTMVNISLGGAQVSTTTKHAMGQRVNVSFNVPTQPHAIEVLCTVRWADSMGVGLQVDGLRARDVWALNEYFKQLAP